MAGRFGSWVFRKVGSRETREVEETMLEDLRPRRAPNSRKDTPPPPYSVLNVPYDAIPHTPRGTSQTDTVEALRARNPRARPRRRGFTVSRAPSHGTTPHDAASAAASSAITGVVRALDEDDHRMIAARAVQAIAVAVSTSRSYAAFVAATTAAESAVLILREAARDNEPDDRVKQRARDVMNTAVNTALAADAGVTPTGAWPHKVHNTSSSATPARYGIDKSLEASSSMQLTTVPRATSPLPDI